MQGRQDSNLRRAVLEAAVLAAELRPYWKMKTARQMILGAVLRSRWQYAYVGTFSPSSCSIHRAHG